VSLKRDNFNTPSEILFFEKENGSFELLYFKTAVWFPFAAVSGLGNVEHLFGVVADAGGTVLALVFLARM